MEKLVGRFVNLELWRDFYDELWRARITLFGREVARFKFDVYEAHTFSGRKTRMKIARLTR